MGILDNKWVYRFYDFFVYLFFFSFIFSIRPILGFATIMLAATAIVIHKLDTKRWWNPGYFNLFNIGLILYFVLQTIALLYTKNQIKGMAVFQTNLGMLVLPVGLLYSSRVNSKNYKRWMYGYLVILFAAAVWSLIKASMNYSQSHDSSVFYYHSLVAIYSNHAIQFSVIVFIGIQFLLDQFRTLTRNLFKAGFILLVLFFSFYLFLLSSKLVIIFYLGYLLFVITFTKTFINRRPYRIAGFCMTLAAIAIIFFVQSPIRARIKQELDARVSVIRQDKFTPADYFSGVQFRILTWRFVYEILNEKKAWILGVNPGDAQDVLKEKYLQENMFAGGTPENKTGYLGYHTHNQFLQAVLESGILGLIAFLMICAGLIKMAGQISGYPYSALIVLMLCNCFTDAPLTTQYGIVLFVFFPLFIFRGYLPENQNNIKMDF